MNNYLIYFCYIDNKNRYRLFERKKCALIKTHSDDYLPLLPAAEIMIHIGNSMKNNSFSIIKPPL
nr:MAG TPA: hypothetical protein [Caudoviricetes sp.]